MTAKTLALRILLPIGLFLLSACSGPSPQPTATALPPGERLEQPTPNFNSSATQVPTPDELETSATTLDPLQALLTTQIAQRTVSTPNATDTPAPPNQPTPATTEITVQRVISDIPLTTVTVLGIVNNSEAGLLAMPGGSLRYSLPVGTTVTITGRSDSGDWYAAYLEDGRSGWVDAGSVQILGDPRELVAVTESFSPAIVATLIAEANRPVPPNPVTPTTTTRTPIITTPSLNSDPPTLPTGASTPIVEQPTATPRTDLQAVVIATSANVRAGPGRQLPIIGGLMQGDVVRLLARNTVADWLQVESQQGVGWLYAPLVETNIPIVDLPIITDLG